MDKNLDKKNTVIALLTMAVIGLGVYSFGTPSSTQSTGANQDYEFYKHLNPYISLLPDEKLEIVNNRIEKVSESMDQEDSDLSKAIILVYANEINKDKQTEKILTELKKDVASFTRKSAMDENTIFSKNTECAKLSNDIKAELARKYTKNGFATESEELNFIFYSPTLNACVYTTNYTYDYANYSLGKNEYYTKNSNRVYNVSSGDPIGDYPSYYFNYSYLSKEEADKEVEKGQRDYVKFILENSGYNAKLFQESW